MGWPEVVATIRHGWGALAALPMRRRGEALDAVLTPLGAA